MSTSVQFGLNVSTGDDPVGDAMYAEALGYDFVSAFDHLHGEAPTYEPWTLLTAIAARTTRLKVATRVLGVPYRHPAVVAKMAETLDRISGGRVILGLGGGYDDAEFAAFGLSAHSPRDKIDGLDEAVRIMRGLWGGAPFSFDGRRYQLRDARIQPKPDHPIPIWVGTFRERGLALAGRLADGWIPSYGMAPPDMVVGMRRLVREAAAAAGRDPDDVLCVYNIAIRVGDPDAARPDTLSGEADALVEHLIAFVRLGFGAFNFIPQGPGVDEQRERLAREVIPHVRNGSI